MRISDWSSDVCSSDLIGSGATTANAEYGIGVSLIAIAATFALLAYQRHVIRQTESVAIGTDHLHYQSDLFLTLSVIIALALDQYFGFYGADALFVIGIALCLAWTALRAYTRAVAHPRRTERPLYS